MKTLYLHIGTGKTGSTSIQKTFRALRSESFYFQDNTKAGISVKNIDQFILRINKDGCHHLIYSHEWLFQVGNSFLKKFSQKLNSIFDVRVLLYIRRQDEFVVSAYQQDAKRQAGKTEHGSISLPLNYNTRRINYYEISSRWAKYFGRDKLTIRVFSRETLKEGCVVKDFASIVGVPVKDSEIKFANESVGMISFKLSHILKEFEIGKKVYQEIVFNAPKIAKARPDRESAELFYQDYIDSNCRLKNEFNVESEYDSIFNNDFSNYPLTRTDLWEEESANMAMVHLCKVLLPQKERKLKKEMNLTGASTMFFKKIIISFILKLIGLAHRVIPNNLYIKNIFKRIQTKIRAGLIE